MNRLKLALHLWALGLREALQLHRCVVLCVLDRSGLLFAKVMQCALLNGGIFLTSIAWWRYVLEPALAWLLQSAVQPLMGAWATALLSSTFLTMYHGLWLLPCYVVTLFVSSQWYSNIADMAYKVHQQQKEQHWKDANGTGNDSRSTPIVPAPATGDRLEGVAQELYRVVLFLVFYVQVYVVSQLPYVGQLLNLLLLSWLYAYYCFDYKWTLMGVRLPDRIQFFEQRWAFFAGFGLPMSLATLALSFYVGAAVVAVLFPLFILVACDSDPVRLHGSVAAAGNGSLGHLPIFSMALWPTEKLVSMLFKFWSA